MGQDLSNEANYKRPTSKWRWSFHSTGGPVWSSGSSRALHARGPGIRATSQGAVRKHHTQLSFNLDVFWVILYFVHLFPMVNHHQTHHLGKVYQINTLTQQFFFLPPGKNHGIEKNAGVVWRSKSATILFSIPIQGQPPPQEGPMILMQMGILRQAEVKDTQMLLIFMGRLVTKICHFFCQPKEGTIVREILQNYHDYMDNLMTPGSSCF